MLCDFYELTMGNGYYRNGFYKRNVYFDVFFRNVPDGGGFAIAAGLEQIVEYIQQLHFSDDDIAYLRGKGIFDEGFLTYLKNFKFHGDIYAVPEGTPVFPGEPLLTVRAPAIEAQLIETYLLLEINHQSLIATKANRIVRAAQGRAVLEFGSRRAQGADGAVIGKKAVPVILDGFDQPGRNSLHPQKEPQPAAIVFRRHGIAQNGHSAALLKAYLRVLYHKTAPYANPNVWNGARKKSAQ